MKTYLPVLVCTAALGAAACGTDEPAAPKVAAKPASAPAHPRAVDVEAGEWFFRAPERLAPGPVLMRLRNTGKRTHQLALARLGDGVSLDEAIEAGGAGGTATPLGEVVARPGVTGELRADLTPGRYALICFEENGGKPHFMRGQKMTFDVR